MAIALVQVFHSHVPVPAGLGESSGLADQEGVCGRAGGHDVSELARAVRGVLEDLGRPVPIEGMAWGR